MKEILKGSETFRQINGEFEKWWEKNLEGRMSKNKYLARKAWFASRGFKL
jgi:hypothetical protein